MNTNGHQDPLKVLVGVPCYTGDVAVETVSSLISCQCHGLFHAILWEVGCCHIGMARNRITQGFLSSDHEKLLFIDTDIVFKPEQVQRITNHKEPVVAGIYTLRSMQAKANFVPDRERWPKPEENGLWRVPRMATGFMCIHRSAFEQILKLGEERTYDSHNNEPVAYDFFPSGLTQPGVFVTDDYGFCDLASRAGVPLHVDTQIVVGHKGTITYQAELKQ